MTPLYKPIERYQLQSQNFTTCQMVYLLKYLFKFHEIFRVGAGMVKKCLQNFMEIDLKLTEKSAKNTQR